MNKLFAISLTKFIKTVVVISLLTWFVGCATYKRSVEFTSEPSGAKIEVDGQYIGNTPFAWDYSNNLFSITLNVVAYPNPPIYQDKKLYLQKKTINVPMLQVEPSPENSFKVYFDMGYRELAPEGLNKNINYNYEIKSK